MSAAIEAEARYATTALGVREASREALCPACRETISIDRTRYYARTAAGRLVSGVVELPRAHACEVKP